MATVTDSAAFEVTLQCSNCGGEWDEQYEPRTVVRERSDGVRAVKKDDQKQLGGVDRLICPTCELRKHVLVKNRQPIADGDSE